MQSFAALGLRLHAVDAQQLHLKDQSAAPRDLCATARRAVAQRAGDGEAALLAHAHACRGERWRVREKKIVREPRDTEAEGVGHFQLTHPAAPGPSP